MVWFLVAVQIVLAYQHFDQSIWTLFEDTGVILGTGFYSEGRLVTHVDHPEQVYAAKIYNKTRQDEHRIRREIHAQNMVDHWSVPKLLFSFHDRREDQWALVMEYVEGKNIGTIQEDITRHAFFNPNVTVLRFMIAGMLENLRVIHGSGVFHRDHVIPNMILSKNGYIHAIDFSNSLYEYSPKELEFDVIRVCRTAGRFFFQSPQISSLPGIPTLRMLMRRHYRLSKPVSQFIQDCIENPQVDHLMQNKLFDNFDWDSFRNRTMPSPLKQFL